MGRSGWLRAAVLGANDGLLSTGSLILGVAAASAGRGSILVTGVAGIVAGALSMAAGEAFMACPLRPGYQGPAFERKRPCVHT